MNQPQKYTGHYSFYGHRIDNTRRYTSGGVNAAMSAETYSGDTKLFREEGRFDPGLLIDYILNKLYLVSNTGARERRQILRAYSSTQLKSVYNTATDRKINTDNPIFSDIVAILMERNYSYRRVLLTIEKPRVEMHQYNPLSGNSELVIPAIERYNLI